MTLREAIRNAASLDDTDRTADVTEEHIERFRAIELKDGNNGDTARASIRALLVELYNPDDLISGQVNRLYTDLAVDYINRL